MRLSQIVFRIKRKIGLPAIWGKGNRVICLSKGRRCRIIIEGDNNDVHIGENCILDGMTLVVYGDNNKVTIKDNAKLLTGASIYVSDGGTVFVGGDSTLRKSDVEVCAAKVIIGDDCMFSVDIEIRNTDGHKIYDASTDGLINPPQDVYIGNHVWIGKGAIIMKGVNIGDGSVVGRGAIVTRGCPPNSVMAGVPARIVRSGIYWSR